MVRIGGTTTTLSQARFPKKLKAEKPKKGRIDG